MRKIKLLAGMATVVVALVGLTACSEEAATVSSTAEESASVVQETPSIENGGDSEETSSADGESAEDATAKLGDTVEVGGWSLRVTEVAKNADAVVARTNQFNEKPKGQYVLVTYEATYNGSERTASTLVDLWWTLTTNEQKILDPAGQVTPADTQEWPTDARKGGTIKQQVLFDVNPGVLPGSILSVESLDSEGSTVYADFDL